VILRLPGIRSNASEYTAARRNREFLRSSQHPQTGAFGSVLTPQFRAESDVDVLVEFEPDHVPGYFGLIGMQNELSQMFGRRVDLRTPGELSRYFRDRVVATAAVQYERQ
jgi:hypothetical protein